MNLALSTAVGSKTGFSSVISSSRIIMTVPSYWVVLFVPKGGKRCPYCEFHCILKSVVTRTCRADTTVFFPNIRNLEFEIFSELSSIRIILLPNY